MGPQAVGAAGPADDQRPQLDRDGDQRLTATVDNNVGLIKIAPGRNGRTRFTLQLWRVRPLVGIGKRILGSGPAKGAQPIHDPVELELR